MDKNPPSGSMILDKPVTAPDEDRYGFRYVAQQLAHAIAGIGREGSAVIGIEGAWGAGKTSLLSLLRTALENRQEDKTHVLMISPWLDGEGNSPVESLLIPVAAIIAIEEENRLSASQRRRHKQKKSLTSTAETILHYTKSTARRMAPIAEAAALIPGIPNASGALKAISQAELSGMRKTTAEMRAEISKKIADLDLSFIILLDDLDRLEPAQTIEVIRMVKSVADFPRFRYLLCYDKKVLAQAIKLGLGVPDGEQYLQKIVQISFSLPRPESFDLRREFLLGSIKIFESVNKEPIGENMLNDLNQVTDIYGASLKTPRDVQLALNGIFFRYGGIRDYVYLPDLCFLQLIRTTNNGLYDWIEEYLTERAVVESGDGKVSEEEQKLLVKQLYKCLQLYRSTEAKSTIKLSYWVPGIYGYQEDNIKLFSQISDEDKLFMTENRRLGSNAYWRYYFAFSSPQNVLPPDYFDNLFHMAANKHSAVKLSEELLSRINSNGISSQTWLEHILSQLTWPIVNQHSADECAGLLAFFFTSGDEVNNLYRKRNRWFSRYNLDANRVVSRLLKRMLENDRKKAMKTLLTLTQRGKSWVWIANYIRDLLWQNGLAGNRPEPKKERLLSDEELSLVRKKYSYRINSVGLQLILPEGNELGSFIWAWQDIAGTESTIAWIAKHSNSDKAFLVILLGLRTHIISSATGNYLSLKIKDISHFFAGEEQLLKRLDSIEKTGEFPEMIKEIRDAIELSKSY
ncbi:NTPase [Providencia rettgeri]|nr:NTPase [Providencia rettgeri]ELR5126661.1 NTPase [Providencia rettgeri]ELR5243847.1 NTPase [Providencia rettgeri]ELS4584852.1 NTPase [Providencia rettgeri]